MGKRGPAPKSATLEESQGFPGRRKSRTKAALAQAALLQPEACDSPIVPDGAAPSAQPLHIPPPPSWLTSKRARELWHEIFADAGTRPLYKTSDHTLIARYCSKLAVYETMQKRAPKPTIKVLTTQRQSVSKPNPAWTALQQLGADLRVDEALLYRTPAARISMTARQVAGATDPADLPAPTKGQNPASGAGRGPHGILKTTALISGVRPPGKPASH